VSDAAPLPSRGVPGSGTVLAYCELSRQERATTVRKAKSMVGLEREGVFRNGVHSGPGHFAERHGATAEIGRMELDLGHAMEKYPDLEQEVLDGVVSTPAAAVLGRVVTEGLTDTGDDWRALARTVTARQLLRLFLRRRDERLAGETVFTLVAHLTFTALEDLARCRELASRSAKRPVSTGGTIAVLAAEYRRRHDPLWRTPRARRRGDTTGTRDRYVPAETDRAVRARTEDRCRFPLCDHSIWVDRAHGVPHREAGSREASNLHLLCSRHHRQFDAGRFRIEGTPEDPRFVMPDGTPIEGRVACRSGADPSETPETNAPRARSCSGGSGGRTGRARRRRRRAPREKEHGPPGTGSVARRGRRRPTQG
jgi:hypothetical protein